jgi:hypothetical protein
MAAQHSCRRMLAVLRHIQKLEGRRASELLRDSRRICQPLDSAAIGAVWGGTTDRVEGFIADHEVNVCAVWANRVVAGHIKGWTSLPPSVLRRDDPIGEASGEPGARPHSSLRRYDSHPVARADAMGCGSRGIHIDQRVRQ